MKRSFSYFDKAVELDPTDALAYNNRGYTLYKKVIYESLGRH
ncbi:MAG: tetratricopeptide repeat protein [Flavobacteriales bacterium]|nr:tetratricopeptide repeat protein [Flavobacteriales bacterium]